MAPVLLPRALAGSHYRSAPPQSRWRVQSAPRPHLRARPQTDRERLWRWGPAVLYEYRQSALLRILERILRGLEGEDWGLNLTECSGAQFALPPLIPEFLENFRAIVQATTLDQSTSA